MKFKKDEIPGVDYKNKMKICQSDDRLLNSRGVGYYPPDSTTKYPYSMQHTGLSYKIRQGAVSHTFVVTRLQNHDYRPLPK